MKTLPAKSKSSHDFSQKVWVCPNCRRTFKNKNQWHSCVQVKDEAIFQNKNSQLKKIYDTLKKEVLKFGKVSISPVKSVVLFKTRSTFLAVKPRKESIEMEFILERALNEFPVHKTFQYTKKKVVHFVLLDDVNQIDSQILNWLKESYQLSVE